MSILSAEIYRKAEAELVHVLHECTPHLSADAVGNVQHYLDNAELELAFESLLLSINQERVSVSQTSKQLLYPLGGLLGVVDDGVLIGNSWPTLCAVIKP